MSPSSVTLADRRRRIRGTVAVVATLLAGGGLAALEVPYLTGRVNDYADMLSAAAETRIEDRLAALESETGAQFVVLTVPSLSGEALEEFSLRVAETWELGRKGEDDGVLLLVARAERKMRIEVGYGLEARLTDAQSGRILRNLMRPRFQQGDFDGGIERSVEAIVATLSGSDVDIPEDESLFDQPDLAARIGMFAFFLAIITVFALSAIFSSGFGSWFLYVFLMPFFGLFPAVLLHPLAGIIVLGIWVVGFPILKLLLRRTTAGRRWIETHPGWTSWTSGASGGGGFSGGGFSGGGGSFGGGGASGSW